MIPKAPPVVGTVIRYGYLWKSEAEAGQVEAPKDRPAALLLATAGEPSECVVLAITHSAPEGATVAIAIPPDEAKRIGLDDGPSWIVLDEVNTFLWPGPDLRPIPGRMPATIMYGRLSRGLFKRVLVAVQKLLRERLLQRISRDG